MEMVPDEQIAGSIIARLAHEPRIEHKDNIKVDVDHGVVQLFGEVDDPLQKTIAGELASTTPGVKEVENSLGIVVDRPRVTDSDLAEAVERALALEKTITLKEVGTKVHKGIVTLMGRVDTLEQDAAAVRAAEGVRGVRDVVDNLEIGEVKPGETVATVYGALVDSLVNAALHDNGIEVFNNATTVAGGTVYLRGNVNTEPERQKAEEVVSSVRGVRNVENQLVVWFSERSTSPDEVLAVEIEHALGRKHQASPANIKVDVIDGVAHLFGEADSVEQQNAAIEAAQSVEGVRAVTDDITITDRTSEPSGDKGKLRNRKTRR